MNGRRSVDSSCGQVSVPVSHLLPVGKPIESRASRRKERNHHLSLQAIEWRHFIFFAQPSHVIDRPLPATIAALHWLHLRIMEPCCLVLPARRQLQRKSAFPNRYVTLAVPI